MNTNDLNTALYEKMAAEQDKYRDWLKSQPPEEILHHTYEYTVREDIVMAMEDLELTDAQAQALLDSPTPLADVYRHFEKLETGYMDVIRDSIENRADDVCKVLEEQRSIPLYLHSAAYASQHGEMAQYNRSYQANFDCKEAIEHAISAHCTSSPSTYVRKSDRTPSAAISKSPVVRCPFSKIAVTPFSFCSTSIHLCSSLTSPG